ncbi:hypothetical protein NEF87_004912 [Candidatus Lokiarchaeum ossiferum]|uniref:Uncharacterized protein n=1 Tax=Candidatus Lokiarchaeum ossiferum TaxID=2951803 RepID=A0ABY6I0H9_9ARCH|nr:hypothetical protein NEF87_004912 [Candidatus Lokiarchaeum sp. B-35]
MTRENFMFLQERMASFRDYNTFNYLLTYIETFLTSEDKTAIISQGVKVLGNEIMKDWLDI